MYNILVIDDEISICKSIKDILENEGYYVDYSLNGIEGLKKIKENTYDLILCDIKMPQINGIEVLEKIKEYDPDLPVIIITAHGDIEVAVDCIKKGAYDYLQKPIDLNRMLVSIKNATEKRTLIKETHQLKKKVYSKYELIGESEAIKKVKEIIDKVAPTNSKVLITGENGTGKELVAKLIHEKSNRKKGPFIEVNCAAIPSELIESELFGHEKGAFTSAIKQKAGKFELANNGTLFLDEIGDMSLSAQAKVLKAIEENKIYRVGGEKEININVRIIAATNKNLLNEIEKGNFREDLYHRLSVVIINLPSLNERKEDIPLLVDYFNKKICNEYGILPKKFTNEAIEILKNHHYRGNIRELHNIVERLIIFSDNIVDKDTVLKYGILIK